MSPRWLQPLPALLVVAVALAGCSDDASQADDLERNSPDVELSETTGGIRGVVVDETVRPVEGAAVVVRGIGLETTTGDDGIFAFGNVEPGTYFVEASHPLYTSTQQSVEVSAGVQPKPVKLLIERVVQANPYMVLEKFDGFIVCSVGAAFFASEECGEGVGIPGVGRVGGQGNNRVQYDFFLDGPHVQSLIVEQVWEPNSDETGEFYTVVATQWSCDPVCGGNRLNTTAGPSPLYLRMGADALGSVNVTSDERFSTFTWPNWGDGSDHPAQLNVALNQEFELFVAAFYYLPAPEGWSFVAGDEDPFQ